MAAMEQLCRLMDINPQHLTPQENLILEVELFIRICEELREIFKAKTKDYFSLMNVSHEKENAMLEARFLRFVINDILMTEEYSLSGIARYAQIPKDIISDIATGKNKAPSLQVSRRVIELHRNVRPDLYKEVVKKITKEYLTTETLVTE